VFAARHLRWIDVDPATHPFDPSRTTVRESGLWTVGASWNIDDGGPVGRDGLAGWRQFIEDCAAIFATIPRDRSPRDTIELAAAQLLPMVLERTLVSDAWYRTLSTALSWFADWAGYDDMHAAIADAVDGNFSSWVEPRDPAAACANVADAAVKPRAQDVLDDWERIRPTAFQYFQPIASPQPVEGDGHTRYIDEIDQRRDSVRAERMRAALLLCRDSARRGMALTLDQLAEWQAVVLGESQPCALRTTDAFRGTHRYAMRVDLHDRMVRALAAPGPLVVRAARLYLDICFFHPFVDGNARAARLALDHWLTLNDYAIQDAGPIFRLARTADDVPGAWGFAAALDLLVGPTSR
jgi:hypothetical protein